MHRFVNIAGRIIGDDHYPYVIAECCNNFNGDLSVAKEMVHAAKRCGADAAKFQMRLQPGRIKPEDHAELQALCAEVGITYLCTAFDEKGLEILGEMNVAGIKIGSGQVLQQEFVRAAALLGKPLLVSVGGCEVGDIGTAWHIISHTKTPFALMQCTSIYPCPSNRANIGFIPVMRMNYEVPIGFSDHTVGTAVSIASVALGARIIEKHFTLDPTAPGPDQCCSITPPGLKRLVVGCRRVYEARGRKKAYFDEERTKLEPVRISINK